MFPPMVWMYVGFIVMVLALLALDLGVFNRRAHVIRVKEALGWSAFWISLGLAFTGLIYLGYENHWLGLGGTPDKMTAELLPGGWYNDGGTAAIKYVTGYLVEKSLAVDNIFVIAIVFGAFGVPPQFQHRVLFWGIVGALLMRGAMIALGAALLREFAWIMYVFGGFLVLTGVRMLFTDSHTKDPRDNVIVKLVKRLVPVTEEQHGQKFFVRAGRLMVTPLLLALVMVELTDVIFAVDSIPAIFAITTDAFLVFTSNVFAILGLRSLYFALAGMMDSFKYLKVALSFVLIVVGAKMLAHTWLKSLLGDHSNLIMLGVVLTILAVGVIASLVSKKGKTDGVPEVQ